MDALEELKEKAGLALKDPKIVKLVKDAPLSNWDGKVNLSWVDYEVFHYVLRKTGSAKTAEESRKSARALALMRRDYAEEFEGCVSRVKLRRSRRQPKQ